MKNSQFFMIATLSLMISVSAFSQNNGRERIKSPTSSMEVKQAMQERQNKAKEQKAIRLQEQEQQKEQRATRLREREAQRKEAEAKRSEMQEKMQPKQRQMHQQERNAMPKVAVRKKTTDKLQQKEVSKLALDSVVYPELWKETYRYDYYGRIIEHINYNWNVSKWEPSQKYEYVYEGDIIKEIYYYWDGSDWEPNSKYEYALDANGNEIMEAYYTWSSGNWVGNYKYEYAYDANGDQIMEAYYNWSSGKWVGNYKYSIEYNNDIEIITYYIWDVVKSQWQNDEKYEYAEDDYGNTLHDAGYSWNSTTNKWEGVYKQLYAYNSDNKKVLDEYYDDWNDTTNTWIGYEKKVWAYNDNGKYILYEHYNAWNDTTNTWIGYEKEVWAYDDNGNNILYEYYNAWNDTANTWIGNYKEVSAYGSDNNPLSVESYNWSDSTGTWMENEKFTYTYARGIQLDYYHYVWDTDSNDWRAIEKTIGTIHPNGGISLRINYQWNVSVWDTISKWETMAYDTLGHWLETEVIYYEYNSTWEEQEKTTYTWDSNDKCTEKIIYRYISNNWEKYRKYERNHDIYGNETMYACYNWSSGAWVGSGNKFEYAYDANGIQTMYARYSWSSGKWEGNYKKENAYDANGYETLAAYYNWNDSVWVENYKYEWAYDANGYQTLNAYYTWGDSVWVGNYKYERAYDANGNQTMIAYYNNWSSGKWIGNYRNEWAKDANGNSLLDVYQNGWDSTWKYGYKYVYAYDINENQTLSEYSVWDTISRIWVKANKQEWAYKDTYIYFTYDFPLYDRYYEWDSTAWELQKSTEWIYNTVGDIIEVIYSELFNDSLKVKTRDVTTTDTTHLRASLVFEENPWDIMFSQHLRTDYYAYDSVGTIIMHDSVLYYWSSINVWSPPTYTISGKVTVDGNPLKGVQITYATSKSVTTNSSGEYTVSVDSGSTVALVPSKAGYVFTPTSITCSNVSSNLYNKDFQATDVGIADVDNTNTELVVYPNPTKGIVYISSECDIKLYDIQGKKLQEIRGNQIDISSYPQGMYFLKVESKTLKVVKE